MNSDFGFPISDSQASHPDGYGGPGKRLYIVEFGRRNFGDVTESEEARKE